ncbi:Phosphoglycerate mutase [Globisporangium polare]
MAPLTFVRGFFSHNDDASASSNDGVSVPARMGLLKDKTWADVNELTSSSQTHGGPKVKLVLLLRHGEGLHNADKARVGDQAWENEYQFLSQYIDAPLTVLGVTQSKVAGVVLEEQLSTGGLQLERVIVSPLDRTLETYAHAFANLPHIPVTAMEITRETLGVCPCDQRKLMRDKLVKYPQVDFSGVTDEDDVLWQADHRESDAEIEVRALKFLNEVYWDHPEGRVAVVSHSGFSRACFRALGHRHYRPQNAEFIPLLLTSEPAPSAHH